MPRQFNPEDLIVIEAVQPNPRLRVRKPANKRIYKWTAGGSTVKIHETSLIDRLDKLAKLVCTVDMVITKLLNVPCIVIDTSTGEVFNGASRF
jgi:hypothetical protein